MRTHGCQRRGRGSSYRRAGPLLTGPRCSGVTQGKDGPGVPVVAQRKRIRPGTMRLWVRYLALHSRLRIGCCRELWCRSKTQLGSGVAVAVVSAGSCSSSWTPSLGTSTCCRCGPKKQNNNNKNPMEDFKQYNPIYILRSLWQLHNN